MNRRRQHGVALMAMLAVIVLGAAWWTVTAISTPISREAEQRAHNARVMQQAKTAILGWVAQQAATSGEENPGRLPCPEASGNIGGGNEGIASGVCAPVAIGRFAWRTLGLDKLRDAANEPLWYVVSPGWTKPNNLAGTFTTINSNCANPASPLACAAGGQLSVNGAANSAVALIIAPGAPVQVQPSMACAARTQTRDVPSPAIDLRNYLECENATLPSDRTFATTGPAGSFNDQVLVITAAEVLAVVDAAIASRFAREFGPSMRYCDGLWPACNPVPAPAPGAARVVYPFAATFGDPTLATYRGVAGVFQGLLPLAYSASSPDCAPLPAPQAPFCSPPATCNPADLRCAPNLITYRDNPVIVQTGAGSPDVQLSNFNCAVAGAPSTLNCTVNSRYSVLTPVANRWMTFTMAVTSNNVGMALRTVNTAVQMTGTDPALNAPFGYTVDSAVMNNDGSAIVTYTVRVPGAGGGLLGDLSCGLLGALLQLLFDCQGHDISLPFHWRDPALLHAASATTAWYYRNGWHQHMYYAVAQGNAPSGGGDCTAPPPGAGNCLTVFGAAPANTHRAIAILPGLAFAGQVRPPTNISHWLEGGNANLPLDAVFWTRDPNLMIHRTFNDRLVILGSS